eukprot:7881441-Pyramimonas_sp.AAC.1
MVKFVGANWDKYHFLLLVSKHRYADDRPGTYVDPDLSDIPFLDDDPFSPPSWLPPVAPIETEDHTKSPMSAREDQAISLTRGSLDLTPSSMENATSLQAVEEATRRDSDNRKAEDYHNLISDSSKDDTRS